MNGLPLSLDLSWLEQKAVIILLTLLHLGVKNVSGWVGRQLGASTGDKEGRASVGRRLELRRVVGQQQGWLASATLLEWSTARQTPAA